MYKGSKIIWRRKNIRYPCLYPAFLSGRDLINFYQDIRKAPRQQVDDLIRIFRARHYLSAPIGTYSSGMIKKLSLILAFIGTPSLIVLDEPLITLDEETVPLLHELINESYRQRKISFLFSSHLAAERQAASTAKLWVADKAIHLTV